MTVREAWAPPSLNQPNAVGFLTLHATDDDALTSVTSDCCTTVETHSMTMQGDVMRMRRIDEIHLPAHEDVQLKSGGYHLMLIGLKKPLDEGDSVPVTLNFKHAKPVTAALAVKSRDKAAAERAHEHHEHMGHH